MGTPYSRSRRRGEPDGEEPHPAQAEECQRIQVAVPAQQSPVQTGPPAVARTGLQPPDDLACRHPGADRQGGGDRQITGAQRRLPGAGMGHRHHTPPADPPREGDRARGGGSYLRAVDRRQVHPAMPAGPALRRWVEAAQHRRPAGHRPGAGDGQRFTPSWARGLRAPGGRRRRCEAAEQCQQQPDEQQRGPTAGAGRFRRPAPARRAR